jgi:hypothetical protein
VYTIKGLDGKGFAATAYDTAFTYSVGSYSGSYSIADYLKAVKNNANADPMMKDLAEAYYNFAEKAKLL